MWFGSKFFLLNLGFYDPSIIRNIGRIQSFTHLRQIATALRNHLLIGVGDASIANNRIGHILETKPNNFSMRGVAPVDCVEEDKTSNRGECFTVLALCTLINALCRLFVIKEGSVTIYCDNVGALPRKRAQECATNKFVMHF